MSSSVKSTFSEIKNELSDINNSLGKNGKTLDISDLSTKELKSAIDLADDLKNLNESVVKTVKNINDIAHLPPEIKAQYQNDVELDIEKPKNKRITTNKPSNKPNKPSTGNEG